MALIYNPVTKKIEQKDSINIPTYGSKTPATGSVSPGQPVYRELDPQGNMSDTYSTPPSQTTTTTSSTSSSERSSRSGRSRTTTTRTQVTPEVQTQIETQSKTTITGITPRPETKVEAPKPSVSFSPEQSTFVTQQSYSFATSVPLSQSQKERQETSVRRAQMRSYFDTEYKDATPEQILRSTRIEGGREKGVTATFQPLPKEEKKVVVQPKLGVTERLVYAGVKKRSGYENLTPAEFKEGYKETPLGKISIFGSELKQGFQEAPKEVIGEFSKRGMKFDKPISYVGKEIFIGAGKVTGVVVGEALEDPAKDLATYSFGFGVGKVVKYASPVIKGLSVELSQTGKLGAGLVKGSKIGGGVALGGFSVVSFGSQIMMADDKAEAFIRISKEFALFGGGFSQGVKGKVSYGYEDVKAFVKGKKRPETFDWKIEQPAIALTSREALSQRPGVQTTLSGNLVSDKTLFETVTSGVALERKSPLNLPKSYYESVYKSESVSSIKSPEGKFLRLDDSFGFPRFTTTESGQAVIKDIGVIGSRTKGFVDTRVRLQSQTTGKEYDVPISFVERRLLQDPSLRVIGQPSRQLFATEPVGALISTGKQIFSSFKPDTVIKSVESATPILRPRLQADRKPTFSFSPFSLVSGRLEEPSLVNESVQEKGLKVFVKPMFSVASVSDLGLSSKELVDERSKSESLVLSFSGVKSKSDVVSKIKPISSLDISSVSISKPVFDVPTKPDTPRKPRSSFDGSFKTPDKFGSFPSVPNIRTGLLKAGRVGRASSSFRSFFGAVKTASPGGSYFTEKIRTIRLGGIREPKKSKKKSLLEWDV